MEPELDQTSIALVVVDMQYASACRTTGLGAFQQRMGRTADGNYRFTRIEELVIPNIQLLLDAFRRLDLHRVFVRLGAQLTGCADLIPSIREIETAITNVSGEREYEILEELAPLTGEPIVTKLSTSAFSSSGIDALLRNLGVTTLIFTGVSTSECVDLTARDAADRGYRCSIVEDAVAEDREDFHHWTLELFRHSFGEVTSTAAILGGLGL